MIFNQLPSVFAVFRVTLLHLVWIWLQPSTTFFFDNIRTFIRYNYHFNLQPVSDCIHYLQCNYLSSGYTFTIPSTSLRSYPMSTHVQWCTTALHPLEMPLPCSVCQWWPVGKLCPCHIWSTCAHDHLPPQELFHHGTKTSWKGTLCDLWVSDVTFVDQTLSTFPFSAIARTPTKWTIIDGTLNHMYSYQHGPNYHCSMHLLADRGWREYLNTGSTSRPEMSRGIVSISLCRTLHQLKWYWRLSVPMQRTVGSPLGQTLTPSLTELHCIDQKEL